MGLHALRADFLQQPFLQEVGPSASLGLLMLESTSTTDHLPIDHSFSAVSLAHPAKSQTPKDLQDVSTWISTLTQRYPFSSATISPDSDPPLLLVSYLIASWRGHPPAPPSYQK